MEQTATCFVQLTGPALSEPATLKTTGLSKLIAVCTACQSSVRTAPICWRRSRTRPRSPLLKLRRLAAEAAVPDAARSLKLGKRARGFKRTTSRLSARSAASDADIGASAANAGALARKPSEIVLVRSRMFYARSSRNKAGRVEIVYRASMSCPVQAAQRARQGASELDPVFWHRSAYGVEQSLAAEKPPISDTANEQSEATEMPNPSSRQEGPATWLSTYFRASLVCTTSLLVLATSSTTTQPFRDYTVREPRSRRLAPSALRRLSEALFLSWQRYLCGTTDSTTARSWIAAVHREFPRAD